MGALDGLRTLTMDLFNKDKIGKYVFAVVPEGAKEGTPPTYESVGAPGIDQAEQVLSYDKKRNAYKHPLGRYDEEGYYCTYCPSVEGIKPGRFVRHPLAEQARTDYYKRVDGKDYGTGTSNF